MLVLSDCLLATFHNSLKYQSTLILNFMKRQEDKILNDQNLPTANLRFVCIEFLCKIRLLKLFLLDSNEIPKTISFLSFLFEKDDKNGH